MDSNYFSWKYNCWWKWKNSTYNKLASKYENVAVILRGMEENQKKPFVVSKSGKILRCKTSGDEGNAFGKFLPKKKKKATIIVSEDREKSYFKSKELGCKIVFR